MIKPTVGRSIHYFPNAASIKANQPTAAIITFATEGRDDDVHLITFPFGEPPLPVVCVYLWQGEGNRPETPHAEWMPYQAAQAEAAK